MWREVCWDLRFYALAERLIIQMVEREPPGCRAIVCWLIARGSWLTLARSGTDISQRSSRAADWPEVNMWVKACLLGWRSRQTS